MLFSIVEKSPVQLLLIPNPVLIKGCSLASAIESERDCVDDAIPPPPKLRYLTSQSKNINSMLGGYISFEQRFVAVDDVRIWDRLLKIIWILPREPKNGKISMRLDWESAQKLAQNLKARLPSLEELKTLITDHYDSGVEAYINAEYFHLNPRTQRCWSNVRAGLFEPYHRCYVDFSEPACGSTSMSEIYCTLLIASDNVEP